MASKDEGATKSVASETSVPSGLDVVPMEPGTIVGARDQQGTDGTPRTDRPGEILGTPIPDDTRKDARARELARTDFVTSEVDRANREELPLLGGPAADTWEPTGPSTTESASAARSTTARAATATTDSGIRVGEKVDRG